MAAQTGVSIGNVKHIPFLPLPMTVGGLIPILERLGELDRNPGSTLEGQDPSPRSLLVLVGARLKSGYQLSNSPQSRIQRAVLPLFPVDARVSSFSTTGVQANRKSYDNIVRIKFPPPVYPLGWYFPSSQITFQQSHFPTSLCDFTPVPTILVNHDFSIDQGQSNEFPPAARLEYEPLFHTNARLRGHRICDESDHQARGDEDDEQALRTDPITILWANQSQIMVWEDGQVWTQDIASDDTKSTPVWVSSKGITYRTSAGDFLGAASEFITDFGYAPLQVMGVLPDDCIQLYVFALFELGLAC
ncbi:hypothetical protein C8R44DRAFT_728512 [Mycena epipterygia]|nr:hypothetical protein C8R44DRAFT_728512 [Mycena epipterygia]